jgi:hypothetical protein
MTMIAKPSKTATLPQGPLGPIGLASDPIIQLRVTGHPPMPLDAQTKTFSLGRDGTCSAVLDLPTVSSVHCFLERRPVALRVVDNATKNGTHFGGAAVPNFELRPGEEFVIGGATVVALTAPAVAAEPELRRLLGTTNQVEIDRAMQLALARHAIAIVGDPGCGHREVASALHLASAHRARHFVDVGSIDELRVAMHEAPDRLRQGSFYLHVDAVAKLKATQPKLAATLASMAGRAGIVVYVGTPDPDHLVEHLGMSIDDGHTITIPTLRARAADILGLLELMLGDEMAKLTPKQRKAIVKHRWPGNLDELRADAAIMRAVLAHGGIRPAARATGMVPSAIHRVVAKFALTVADRDE